MKRDSQRGDHGERRLKVSRKTEHRNSSQRSEENPVLEEGWSWRKSLGRNHEARDVKASTDWDEFLIYQVFLNSIYIPTFIVFIFFCFFELFEAVYQLLFNLACVLDLNLEKLWISCRSCESAVEVVNQLEAVNQRLESCVAQLTASCETQPLLVLFYQLNLIFKSCQKI